MEVKAKAKYIRISPRKARLVADVVRGLDLTEAFGKLNLLNKKAVKFIEKLLLSALANAEHNFELNKDNLYIKEIMVDDGPTFYRWMPRAFGRATPLRKRTSLISVTLSEKVATEKKQTSQSKNKVETIQVEEKITDKNIEEKIDLNKKEKINEDVVEDHKAEKLTENRKGGNHNMQQTSKPTKKEKGIFKKMFRRKSGM